MQLPLPPANTTTASGGAAASSSHPTPKVDAPPGWRVPVPSSPTPLLSLRAACGRHEGGDLFVVGAQRCRINATCVRQTAFSVEDDEATGEKRYAATVELRDETDAAALGEGGFVKELALHSDLVEKMLGQRASVTLQRLNSDEKAVKKETRQAIKRVNAQLEMLQGVFTLGDGGARGLAVMDLPERVWG